MTRLVFEVGVDRRVHARDKETGDRRDVIHGLALGGAPLEAFNEGLGDLPVVLNREDHRDVDIDAAINGFFDRRQTFLRRRDLDHHVLPAERVE